MAVLAGEKRALKLKSLRRPTREEIVELFPS